MVQKLSTNRGQSHLKLQASIKITSFPTLNANIFQSVWSNFMKFLLHDFIQVKYKILSLILKKDLFLLFSWMNTAETIVLSGFWEEK